MIFKNENVFWPEKEIKEWIIIGSWIIIGLMEDY
jgi:hypothetical protein